MTFVQEKVETVRQAPYQDRWWHPRVWHGYQLGAWLRMLAAHGFRISPYRWPTALSITLCSVGHSALGWLQRAIYSRRLRRAGLPQPPLFIVGHWRCGTTLLHELLSVDPRHTYPTTYQCFVPSHFLLTQGVVPRWTRFLLPQRRPMDNVPFGWDRPQEDEFALCALGEPSPYWMFAFPNHPPRLDYLDMQGLSPAQRRRWERKLREFLTAVCYGTNKRVVLKSPTHTARVGLLREMFPQARFVHLVRHPYQLFRSTLNMMQRMAEVEALHWPRWQDRLEELVLQMCPRMYRSFHAAEAHIPENRLIHVRFEDLVQDPLAHLVRIYEQLELGPFDVALPHVERYLESMRGYRQNPHWLDPQLKRRIDRAWAFYFQRYGYSPDEEPV